MTARVFDSLDWTATALVDRFDLLSLAQLLNTVFVCVSAVRWSPPHLMLSLLRSKRSTRATTGDGTVVYQRLNDDRTAEPTYLGGDLVDLT